MNIYTITICPHCERGGTHHRGDNEVLEVHGAENAERVTNLINTGHTIQQVEAMICNDCHEFIGPSAVCECQK